MDIIIIKINSNLINSYNKKNKFLINSYNKNKYKIYI